MEPMTSAKHRTGTPGLGAAWAVLIGTGATSVTYNVVHATQGARLEVALALLLGFMPAFVAACLSHVAAVLDAPWFIVGGVLAVVGAGMVLSASATASVISPADPGWRGWLFGFTLDLGALLALWAIMNSRRRKVAVAAEIETAREAVARARAEAAEAAGERSRLAEELTELREQAAADLASARGELEAERTAREAEVQALGSALNKARNKARSSGQKRRAASPRNTGSGSPLKPDVPSDVDTQAEALRILASEPDISGGELGRRLGKSERYGCMLKNRLVPSMPGPDQENQGS